METTLNNITNFATLVSNFGIEIPTIQRDYVQGRVHQIAELIERNDDKAKALLKKFTDEREKRDKFVTRLINAIHDPDKNAIQLTFLYGTIEHTSGSSSHHQDAFIPLDGQQRLTTLFLLSWALLYLLEPDDRLSIESRNGFNEFKKGLRSLGYKTRPSSHEFCSSLFLEKIIPISDCAVQELIRKQTWFRDDWILDPSVAAMMQMLEQFVAELGQYPPQVRKSMMENLLDGKGISFEVLDMEDYRLTDGLYIKMNARGKQLTVFENWKSEFIGFLEKHHKAVTYDVSPEIKQGVFGGKLPTLKEYFEYSIEHQWTDLFWRYCQDDIVEHARVLSEIPNPSKRQKDCYPVIDKYFMNFFTAAHQWLFYLGHKTDDAKLFQDTLAQREETFEKVENVKALFDWLDILKSFNDGNIYEDLFYVGEGNQFVFPDKVRLFDGGKLNLLTRCAKEEKYTIIVQFIHYGMLRYAQNTGRKAVSDDFKSFVREVRNLAEGEYSVRNQDVNVVNTLQVVDIDRFEKKINQMLNEINAQSFQKCSSEQARIEDFDFILGNFAPKLMPLDHSTTSPVPLATLQVVLKSWDALDEFSKIALLVAYGYKGRSTMLCSHGQTYLFGNNNRWRPVFMGDKNLDSALIALCKDYHIQESMGKTGVDALTELLEKKKQSTSKYDFCYYALHYQPFLYAHSSGKKPCMYFSINGNRDELDICSVVYSKKPALALHTDPIVFATKELLYTANTQKHKVLFLEYSTQGAERACIRVFRNNDKDGDPVIATFKHIPGIHGRGGWELINDRGVSSIVLDSKDKDRVIAGADILRRRFPDYDFADKG